MDFFAQAWKSIRNNPGFIAAYSTFDGILVTQLWDRYTSGHTDWTLKACLNMVGMAALLTVFALYHLKLPAPGQNPKA